MRLTKLHLAGFKSFADAVVLQVDDGVTAVVGPNGCGKSNISDAVRWVLGEQRPRVLRGARMDEIIFQGSAKRRPQNLAEVSLHFDNSGGVLPVGYAEVVVTRRLSRSGQSEYLINQSPVRLRDVQDLLRGTGIGSDVGAVIEAQMIDRLLSERAEERRSLFEEAAGIGLYRDRKVVTERRLERTSDDLQRLDDLIREVQTQVRSLARQRGRAERHSKFTAERFSVVATLVRRDLSDLDTLEEGLAAQRAELARRLPLAQQAITAAEREREAKNQSRMTAEAKRTELERRLAQTRVDIGKVEGDLHVAEERLRNAADRRARAQRESEEAAARAAQAGRERDAAADERRAAESARQSLQTELDLRSVGEDEAESRLGNERSLAREAEHAMQQLVESVRALAGEQTAIQQDLHDLDEQAADVAQRQEETELEWVAARDRVEEIRGELVGKEREVHEAAADLERARHALASAREHEAAVGLERRAAEEALAQLTARRRVLEELERDRAGLAPAARRLLEARLEFGEGNLLGPLSDFLHTQRADPSLVERLLGDWLHAVLVRDEATARAIEDWHRHTQPGLLALLPTSPGPPNDPQGRANAARLGITATEPADRWLAALLAGDEAIDDEGNAIRRSNGAIFLAGSERGDGPLLRRAELESLGTQLAEARQGLTTLEQKASEAGRVHREAEAAQAAAGGRAERARSVQRETLGTADDAERALQRAERERNEAQGTLTRINHRIDERNRRLQEIGEGERNAERNRQQIESELATRQAALLEFEAAKEAARERRVHWQVEEAQVSARESAARAQEQRAGEIVAAARDAIASLEAEIATIDREREELTARNAEWSDQLAERRLSIQQMERAVADAENTLTRDGEELGKADTAVENVRTEAASLNERSHKVELQEAELSGQRRVLVERFEAEWHRSIDSLGEDTPIVDGDESVLREQADHLARELERIGPVNPLAVEEHAEEVKRLDFLTDQRDDLVRARDALLEAIREIDTTARGMFLETFDAIRANFHSVFQALFEGGDCDVRLTDPEDPLGSTIEIHAAPRGKRTQRIHLLSSGERALVAISLLFSIYLTKPNPFCLLDEVDAPLDDANVARFVRLLDEFKADTQFVVITHNPRTMQVADAVYGVTMQEPGVSTIVGVRLGQVEPV